MRLLELPSSGSRPCERIKNQHGTRTSTVGHKRPLYATRGSKPVVEKNLSVRETEGLVRSILEGKERKKTTKPKDNQDIVSLEKELSEKLGAKVAIQHANSGKGRLTISYSSVDELEGILERIK